MWLLLTPVDIIYRIFIQIQSTATEFCFFPMLLMLLLAACCLLVVACCLLLAAAAAAKPSRSTLDTKKGYKTKTGSTSSVTPTHNLNQGVTASLNLSLLLTPSEAQIYTMFL